MHSGSEHVTAMHAATQKPQGTIGALALTLSAEAVPALTDVGSADVNGAAATMTAAKPRLYKIQGITREGKAFRPSDWAERLAGALASFQPPGAGVDAHIRYSPYCVPRVVGGVKCVIVSEALRDIEPMALDFALHFARDNELLISEVAPGEPVA